jgi:hypothetical protein
MTYLVFTYLCFVATAVLLESRLLLNGLYERLLMIFSLAAGLLILAVQLLSLAASLNGGGLMLAGVVSLVLGLFVQRALRTPADRQSWKSLLISSRAELDGGGGGGFVPALLLVAMGLMAINALVGTCMIPLGDPYHFERQLFWRQNQSIEPFVTYDPRITCTSFAGEALGVAGFIFCKSGVPWVATVWVAGCLTLPLMFLLARRLGCSPRASAMASVLPLGIHSVQQHYLEADSASCLAALWAGAAFLFLLRCGAVAELSAAVLTRLGCSAFCFLLACGTKNTIVFLAPFFLLALAASLRSRLFTVKALSVLALVGLLALLGSGVGLNFVWNYKWYGNICGPTSMQGHLSHDRSAPAIWTRCCRGAVVFVLDPQWLPRSTQKTYESICHQAVHLLGGKSSLSEDDPSLFNFNDLLPGEGIGPLGPLFLLPAFVYGVARFWRHNDKTGNTIALPGAHDFCVLLAVVTGYAFLSHVFLRSQDIGVWRLMPAFAVLAIPACGLLLEKPAPRLIALILAGICLLNSMAGNLSMVSNRFAVEDDNLLQKVLLKLGKRAPVAVDFHWGDEAPEKAFLREPYNNREIGLLFLQRARHPAVIGFAGGFGSDASTLFGADLSNRITSLVDCSHPEQLLEPATNVDYLVFPQYSDIEPVKDQRWAEQHGYHPFLRVDRSDACVFLSFQKDKKASFINPIRHLSFASTCR